MTAIELTPSQKQAYETIMKGYNVFLTGHAGTGKSFLTNKIIEDLEAKNKNVIVAAPTGVAAINVGGTTIHRLFQLRPDVYTGKKPVVPGVFKETDVLIIDEISMCRIDLFEYIGKVLRKTHRRIQVIVVGDFCQLPPVMPQKKKGNNIGEKDILDEYFGFDVGGGYAFLAPQWARINFITIELKEVVRQSDPEFINALDQARLGEKESLNYFATRSSKSTLPGSIYLAGRNAEVDQKNAAKLSEISNSSFTYYAESSGEVSKEDKRVALEALELKVGARVMLTTNDPSGDFCNGSMGTVSKLTKNRVFVQIDDGEECEISKNTWEVVRYEVEQNKKGEGYFKRNTIGKYTQYPIKLAWAVTIHKSQGQTFNKVDLNPNCWDSGQLYVALSRITSIDGLHLSAPLYSRYLYLDPAVKQFYQNIGIGLPDDAGMARDMTYKEEKNQRGKQSQNNLQKESNEQSEQLSLF